MPIPSVARVKDITEEVLSELGINDWKVKSVNSFSVDEIDMSRGGQFTAGEEQQWDVTLENDSNITKSFFVLRHATQGEEGLKDEVRRNLREAIER